MNIPTSSIARAQTEPSVNKLALISLCMVFMTAAIAKQVPAHAADAIAVVSLADLDLSTEQGMQMARDRLDKTARRLCKQVVNPWALSHHTQYLRCVDDATTAALGQLHGQALVANAQL
jgi:UrcA family protein